MNKEVSQFQEELKARGWDVQRTAGDHFKYTHRASGDFIFGASTPSDHRSITIERTRANRIERAWSGEDQLPKVEGERREKARPRTRVSNGGRVEYGIDPRDPWPNLPTLFTVEATVQNDGKFVKMTFPGDFIGHRFYITGSPNKRGLSISLDKEAHEMLRGYQDDESYAVVESGFLSGVRPTGRSHWNARRSGGEVFVGTLFDYLTTSYQRNEPTPGEITPYRAPRVSSERPTPTTRSAEAVEAKPRLPVPTTNTTEKEKNMNATPQRATLTAVRNDVECDTTLLRELVEGGKAMSELARQLGYTSGQAVSNWIKDGAMPVVAWRLLQLQERQGSRPMSDEDRIRTSIMAINDAVRHKNMKLQIKSDGTLGATVVTEVSYG